MKRTLAVATTAIALLLGGSLVIVLVLTRPGPTPAAPEPPAQHDLSTAVALAPVPPAAASSRGSTEARSPRSAPRDPLPGAPAADRVTRKAIRRALLAAPLQSRLARCTDHPRAFGGAPSDSGRVPRARPASLLLEIETLAGELRIVDAQVRDWGGASEATVSCARAVLSGQVLPLPSHRRPVSERLSMPFLLNPRGGT